MKEGCAWGIRSISIRNQSRPCQQPRPDMSIGVFIGTTQLDSSGLPETLIFLDGIQYH